MTSEAGIPHKLYKYRPFGVQCLSLLTQAKVHYSDPTRFNDPLDCAPTIETDAGLAELIDLGHIWLEEKLTADEAAAEIEQCIPQDFRDETEAFAIWYQDALARKFGSLLRAELGTKGVFSLSATWSSPLMWSHYADQHQGICIEFDTQALAHPDLEPVNYTAPRSVLASDLIKWKIHKSPEAERRVYETYFLAKANEWKYEQEWRDISAKHGSDFTTFPISSIYFGFRCLPEVQVSVMALSREFPNTAFYEVYPKAKSFDLERRFLNVNEELAMGVRTSPHLDFRPEEPPRAGQIAPTLNESLTGGMLYDRAGHDGT